MGIGELYKSLLPADYDGSGSRPADLAITNASVFTCDVRNPGAEAAAVKGGRISYVGDRKGLRDFVGPDTRVVNAKGRTLTPGFVDNHCHLLWMHAALALSTDLSECETLEDLLRAVSDISRDNPDMPFVFGFGWKYEYLPGGVAHRSVLDELIGDRPVILWSIDGHSGWANTPALDLMQRRNPGAFRLLTPGRQENTGELTGMFYDFYIFSPMDFFSYEELGEGLKEKMLDAMEKGVGEAVSLGITTVTDIQIYQSFIPMVLEFKHQGRLTRARVRCSYFVDHHRLEDKGRFLEDLNSWRELGQKESDSHLILGDSVKLYIDGIASNYTALMKKPYSDRPDSYGHALWSQQDFDRVIELIDDMGLQACTHGCGDRGIEMIIHAYKHARRTNGERDSRHRIEHCEFPHPRDMEEMAEYSVFASMQPAHFFGDEVNERHLGQDRLSRMMPWKSLARAGVDVSFGSDWCAGPLNPVYGLIISGTRFNYRGKRDWAPEEKLDLETSIRHYTLDSARALMMEDQVGSLEVGKLGDMVLWNHDPRKFNSWWFLLTRNLELGSLDDFVDMTTTGGEVVYERAGASF